MPKAGFTTDMPESMKAGFVTAPPSESSALSAW